MAKEIRDILIGREYRDKMNNKKTAWTKIGTLFINEGENGVAKIGGVFDALPAHGENFIAVVRKPYEGGQEEQKPADETIGHVEEEKEVRIEDVPF